MFKFLIIKTFIFLLLVELIIYVKIIVFANKAAPKIAPIIKFNPFNVVPLKIYFI